MLTSQSQINRCLVKMISLSISPLALCLVLSLFVGSISGAAQHKLPKTWKTCKRSDPQMNKCLKSAVQDAVLSLKNGLPSLGVLPVDPLHFEHLTLADGKNSNNPVSLSLDFKNLDLIGISTLNVETLKADWDKGLFEAYVTFSDPLQLIGDYVADGKVLILPVRGFGKCKLSFDNFAVNLKMIIKEHTKNGKKYFDVTKMTVELETTRFHLFFQNLFNGDKALGDQMNIFVNENWEEILKELKPAISRSFGEGFRQVANRIFSRVPADLIAPP